MSETRECSTCWWFSRTCNISEGFCEEKEELVFEDDAPCERYMSWRKEIRGDK